MNNLSEEDFWNKLHEECPGLMRMFFDFLDKYKKESGWDFLFSWNFHPATTHTVNKDRRAKFHDIPLEMQVGIILRFSIQINCKPQQLWLSNIDPENWARDIRGWFKTVESYLFDLDGNLK